MLSHTISGRFPPPPPDVLLLRPDLVRSRTRRGVSGGGLERRHDLLGLQPSLGLWAWERPGLWRVPRPDVALNSTRSELGRSAADGNHDLFAARTRYGGEGCVSSPERLQLFRIFGFGVAEDIAEGRVVYRLGEKTYDLIVIKSRAIDMTWDATLDAPEDVVVTRSPELTSDC